MAFFPVTFLLMANLLETPFSNRKVPPVFEQWKIEEFLFSVSAKAGDWSNSFRWWMLMHWIDQVMNCCMHGYKAFCFWYGSKFEEGYRFRYILKVFPCIPTRMKRTGLKRKIYVPIFQLVSYITCPIKVQLGRP